MPDKTINFAARCEYLSAIEAHWPDVMQSLRLHAFPVCKAAFETAGPNAALQTWAGLSNAVRRGASLKITQVELAVRTWAEAHGFQDAWLRDVALRSMQSWAHGETMLKWTYLPARGACHSEVSTRIRTLDSLLYKMAGIQAPHGRTVPSRTGPLPRQGQNLVGRGATQAESECRLDRSVATWQKPRGNPDPPSQDHGKESLAR